MTVTRSILLTLIIAFLAAGQLHSARPVSLDLSELAAAFQDAETVDLVTSEGAAVSTLREVVRIPPPATPVLVKTFKRKELPEVLHGVFLDPKVMGVTLQARYIAIIHTEFHKEYEDVLRHELVHAYISMASPEPLPFWFQEASAVHFSMDKVRKFYGQPSKTKPRMMEGRVVDLTPTYKQKLRSFHFLIEQVGKDRFYQWYKQAVITGNTDARPLLGLDSKEEAARPKAKKAFPLWLGVVIGAAVVFVAVAGYVSTRSAGGRL